MILRDLLRVCCRCLFKKFVIIISLSSFFLLLHSGVVANLGFVWLLFEIYSDNQYFKLIHHLTCWYPPTAPPRRWRGYGLFSDTNITLHHPFASFGIQNMKNTRKIWFWTLKWQMTFSVHPSIDNNALCIKLLHRFACVMYRLKGYILHGVSRRVWEHP